MPRINIPRQVGIVAAKSRRDRGLTQLQVAEAAGVSRQLVNRLETGSAAGIALDKLLRILGASGCALDVYPLEGEDLTAFSRPVESAATPFDPLEEYPFDESLFAPNEEVAS
ncbi:MAG: helix-turn-helix domain-containing protein [Coriobacteriales bacterium]|nr:helix-turn-helix domain-containing protein [Coriobacteriales bacterium]